MLFRSTFANTGSALTSATSGSTYSYTMPSGTLSTDGVYQVRAVATDTATNTATSSAVSFTVDTTRPDVALTYAIASSVPADTSAASGLTYSASLSRPVKAGEVVVVKAVATDTVGGVTATTLGSAMSVAFSGVTGSGTATVGTLGATDLTGYFTYTVAASTNGTVTVAATAPDAAGNSATTSGTTTFTVDTTAPDAPTGLALTTATDTGTSTSDGTTNVTAVSVTGTAEAGSTVALFDGGNAIAGATGTATGGTFTIATTLAVGSHTITATATDVAGNTGSASGPLTVTVDQTRPTVTSISRASSAAALTNTSPAFEVVFSESVSGVVAANFSASKGSGTTGTASIAVSGSGTTYTVTVSGLTGNYGTDTNATVGLTVVPGTTISDVAGNLLTSATVSGANESYNLDNTAPTYAITYSRTAPLKAGAVTLTVTANEALSAAPTISINQPGTTDISSAATTGSGPYTYAYTVVAANASTYVDGSATVTVSGSDAAGNTGTTITSGGSFAIDTTAPTVALTDRKSTRLNSSHSQQSRMPSSA